MKIRFYLVIEEGTVRWRNLFGSTEVPFSELGSIQIKKLNRGMEEICLKNMGGAPVLRVTNLLQNFGTLKILLQDRGRRFGIAVGHAT